MLKLYQLSTPSKLYWETWVSGKVHTIHWGELGTKGDSRELKSTLWQKAESVIQKEVDQKIREGYAPIDPGGHRTLLIEYTIDGMGSASDLEKRHRLQERMDETLGWTGLGNCDGGSIGGGTMEVCCLVVDFDVARSVIAEDLRGTEFANYTRIFDEGAQ